MFLKWFLIKVTNIRVISEITTNNFSVTPVGVYSWTSAQLLLSHICISVLASLKQHWLFCYFITLLIVLLILNDFVLYQHFIFSEFNRSRMFSKQFLPIVVTLQVLHIIFNIAQILQFRFCRHLQPNLL